MEDVLWFLFSMFSMFSMFSPQLNSDSVFNNKDEFITTMFLVAYSRTSVLCSHCSDVPLCGSDEVLT